MEHFPGIILCFVYFPLINEKGKESIMESENILTRKVSSSGGLGIASVL